MAYKVPKVSPSALAATEQCPRFRPSGEDTQAAIDGTLMHEFAEQMVSVPRGQWPGWIATRDASPDMKGMLEEIADALRTIVVDDLPVFPEHRLRMRGGRPRRTPLKSGLYPELELERGQGRHGYVDLLVVSPEGVVTIVDYKSNRQEKDFSLQLMAYACDVHRLAPAHEMFECCVVAPRLGDEAQLRMRLGLPEIAEAERKIAEIEELADRSCNDDSIPGRPSAACEYCHWCGRCRYQAEAAKAVLDADAADIVVVSEKTGRPSTTMALATLVGPGGPYEGEAVTARTFTDPPTTAQRGLRRACLKFLEKLVDACKDDDAAWAAQYTDEQLKCMVPGFSVARVRGRSSLDPSRMPELREAVMARFGMSVEDVFECSAVDRRLLAESLATVNGWPKKKAEDEVKRVYETFSTPGAPQLRWTQKAK